MVKYHRVPYRDFPVEYPPAALPVFVVPSLIARNDYRRVFQLLMALCAGAAVLRRRSHRRARAAACLRRSAARARLRRRLALRSLAGGAHRAARVAALLRNRLGISALLLGHGLRREALAGGARPVRTRVACPHTRTACSRRLGCWARLATAAVWFLPFIGLSPGGVGHSFHAQFARPLQTRESRRRGSDRASTTLRERRCISRPASDRRTSPVPARTARAVATTIVGVLALAIGVHRFARGPATIERSSLYAPRRSLRSSRSGRFSRRSS